MKEVLEVQKEINDIQEEIEAASGQGNYLSHQAALSTINLAFYQVMATHKPDAVHDPSFFTRVLNAFRSGVQWMAELFIGLMYIWPLVLLIIAGIFIWKKSGYTNKKGTLIVGEGLFHFLGIATESKEYVANGIVKSKNRDMGMTSKVWLPFNIAIIIKARVLLDFKYIFAPFLKDKNYNDLNFSTIAKAKIY